jgi:2-polyprenyl-6-methoxyphenol hydroxylase-like FAD-dependent oxidoreductase
MIEAPTTFHQSFSIIGRHVRQSVWLLLGQTRREQRHLTCKLIAMDAQDQVTCCIAGGGPAGMMLGLLLSRAGIDTLVLEKHKDFFRDFRGDTVHPSTLQVLADLGLIEKLLALRHSEVNKVQVLTSRGLFTLGDFSSLRGNYRFVALVPQWDFLNMLAHEARQRATFRLLMEAEALNFVSEDGRVTGLQYRNQGQVRTVRALLTVAADGRHSVLRDQAKLPAVESSPPMDVLWFAMPKLPSDGSNIIFRAGGSKLMAFIDRFDYWQVAYVIPKGAAQSVLAHGVDAVKDGLRELAPEFDNRLNTLTSVDQIKLLTVQSNRLLTWWLPGFLCIGDAAHAMTPVGGVGINLAIQDAVAAANILWSPLASKTIGDRDLAAVQRRRAWPIEVTQFMQAQAQRLVIKRALTNAGPIDVPGIVRFLLSLPVLHALPARFVGIGVRPERPSPALLARIRETAASR